MPIDPAETRLVGRWISAGRSGLVGDDVCRRIKKLTEGELTKLGYGAGGWNTLYLDRADGRFWELSYPQSGAHGGGPPILANITPDDAVERFGEAIVRSV